MSVLQILLRVLLAVVILILSHALLSVFHALNWYPEEQLAKLLLASTNIWYVEWVRWALTAILALALWLVADFFYRRHLAKRLDQATQSAGDKTPEPLPDFEPDIDPRKAFYEILENSDWRRKQDATTDPKGLVSDWRELRLSSDIHKALRNSRLIAWGEESLPGTATTPENPIPAETWDRVEIVFDHSSLPRAFARFKGYTRSEPGAMAWVGIKFSSAQIFQMFPLQAKPSLDRISIIELMAMATRLGWNFTDQHSLQLIDLQDAIRQGGLDGHLTLWGRLNRWPNAEQLMRKEVIEKIPPEHWREFRVHLFGALDNNNFNTYSWHIQPSSVAERGYVDLHVERTQSAEWLARDGVLFKGKTTLQNRI
jgi:hypothetical protein